MTLGHVFGAIKTTILLGIIYYLLITPMGLVMRLVGDDSMQRVLERNVSTYRTIRSPRPRHYMRNQF